MVVSEASAQTNIDQGKSPAEIFANACAVCHKTTRGLATGQNSLMLSSFLREHYTASKDQAAALAAYVLASGGSGPAPQAAQKPSAEHPRTAVEEPRNGETRAGEPKNAEAKNAEPKNGEAKNAEPKRRPIRCTSRRSAKRRLQPPNWSEQKEEEAKPKPHAEPSPAASSPAPAVGMRETSPAKLSPGQGQIRPAGSATRGEQRQYRSETPAGPPVPDQDLNPAPSTTASGETQPSDSPPVPRDNIPD